jgi:DNA recombination protein RmuC
MDLPHFSLSQLQDGRTLLLAAGAGACVTAFVVLIGRFVSRAASRREAKAEGSAHDRTIEAELFELKGRLAQMAEAAAVREAELARLLNDRLDRIGQSVDARIEEHSLRTVGTLAALNERFAVIDAAERTIAELSGNVVSLHGVLADKQARGAFGQVRLEALVEDGLPKGSYRFQAALSNGTRPDCLIRLPYASTSLVIDAKFPLEAFEALRAAADEATRKSAQAAVRRDVGRHIDDMASKYFIAGETQDTALLFVPAESVYAELHDDFAELVQRAYRARIVIVSPNMLMLAIQTMMAILKDVRTREQAGLIRREAGLLLEDARRLHERMLELQRHFAQLAPGFERVLASNEKVMRRARRIEGVDLEEEVTPQDALTAE